MRIGGAACPQARNWPRTRFRLQSETSLDQSETSSRANCCVCTHGTQNLDPRWTSHDRSAHAHMGRDFLRSLFDAEIGPCLASTRFWSAISDSIWTVSSRVATKEGPIAVTCAAAKNAPTGALDAQRSTQHTDGRAFVVARAHEHAIGRESVSDCSLKPVLDEQWFCLHPSKSRKSHQMYGRENGALRASILLGFVSVAPQ